MIPSRDQTGTPRHFHSSTTSGSACLMRARTWESVLPLQSSSSLILASISRDGDSPWVVALFFILLAPHSAVFLSCKGTNHHSSAPARRPVEGKAEKQDMGGREESGIGKKAARRKAQGQGALEDGGAPGHRRAIFPCGFEAARQPTCATVPRGGHRPEGRRRRPRNMRQGRSPMIDSVE